MMTHANIIAAALVLAAAAAPGAEVPSETRIRVPAFELIMVDTPAEVRPLCGHPEHVVCGCYYSVGGRHVIVALRPRDMSPWEAPRMATIGHEVMHLIGGKHPVHVGTAFCS